MANFEDEARDLREKNSELVQEVQYWKLTAAQREKEKLELMKDINELRLKLTRLRSGGAAQARQLDAGLQIASEDALSHLVQASSAITKTIELAKQYMRDRQELDDKSPRWSAIGGTPSTEKVHRVKPLLIGGQSIQPVVSLSRTMLNSSTRSRSLNNTERAVPMSMRMLQDAYIPLTRLDMADVQAYNVDTEADNSGDDIGLEDGSEQPLADESHDISEDFETSRRLDAVDEELEIEDQRETLESPPRPRMESPMAGPSWLLDVTTGYQTPVVGLTLEPDSTTMCEGCAGAGSSPAPPDHAHHDTQEENELVRTALAFTPTVRRRKRSASPPRRASPAPSPRSPAPPPAVPTKHHNCDRELRVMVAKLPMSNEDGGGGAGGDAPPAKRAARDHSHPQRPQRLAVDPAPPKRSIAEAPQSPEHSPRSPERSARSPELSARSPKRSARSPILSARSPGCSAWSPIRSARSPGCSPWSPMRSARSPGCSARSPERSARSPGRSERSPGRSARSPGRSARSPGRSARSRGRSARSRGRSTRSPGRSERSLGRSARSPGRSARSPRRSARSPGRSASSPGHSARSPERSPHLRVETAPPRRHSAMRFDAPSPNGATVLVSVHQHASGEPAASARAASRFDSRNGSRDSRNGSQPNDDSRILNRSNNGRDSDNEGLPVEGRSRRVRKKTFNSGNGSRDSRNGSQPNNDSRVSNRSHNGRDSDNEGLLVEGRSRRARNAVTYREKPLNRKMRR